MVWTLSRSCSMASGRLTMVLLASLPSALVASQLGFAASPGRLSLGRAASGMSASLHAGRSSPRPARLGMGGARMMSASPETEKVAKAEKDTSVVLNPDFTFKMDDIVSVCKRRGFVFQSSEIYNGFNGFYDYGPLGVELKNNIKKIWWRDMVTAHPALPLPPPVPSKHSGQASSEDASCQEKVLDVFCAGGAQVHRREDVVGLDSSIIASPKIWKSSGHVEGFSDPMVDCKVLLPAPRL